MTTLLVLLVFAGLVPVGAPVASVPVVVPAPVPVVVSVRLLSGPFGGRQYTLAAGRLTVYQLPPATAADRSPQPLFQAPLPADAARQRLAALDPAAYHGIANELLDGGGVLVLELHRGSAHQTVVYQQGQYAQLDSTTAFLLAYLNQHVPARLAIGAEWLRPAARP